MAMRISTVCLPAAHSATELSVLVSSRAGDWSRALAALSQQSDSSFEVEVAGPFPTGGGEWSLSGEDSYCCRGQEPALLLLAGGTGVTGWLPGLAAARFPRPFHDGPSPTTALRPVATSSWSCRNN